MKIVTISNNFSISDQITPADVTELASSGVEIIICNRPDGESADQTYYSDIATQAEAEGISTVHLPFTAGQLDLSIINECKALIDSGKKIHAYCRTGNRSKTLYEACSLSDSTKTSPSTPPEKTLAKLHFDVVIVGAGSSGISAASSLLKRNRTLRIALVDPAKYHYYQPGWTLVGGGEFKAEATKRSMLSLIPEGVTWIEISVTEFLEDENCVLLSNQTHIHYNHLVIAAGLKLDWDKIEGLPETLGKNGVTSNYRYDLAPYTWELVKNLKKGKAIFTQPPMPIKCAGAPQKALYLSADYWFKQNLISDIKVHFYNAGGVLFGVEAYVPALTQYMQKYKANLHFSHTLVKIDGNAKTAWFKYKEQDGTEKLVSTDFDMIHVCPPQSAPEFIQQSRLADKDGWVDVDKATLQHNRVKNIWGLGDAANTPNAKTMAAARKQAPVVAQNICDAIDGKPLSAEYDGYGSCPLTVERGKIVLAEFTYGGKLSPSFPKWMNDGTKPTLFAWLLKSKILPPVYWYGMLKGREWLAKPKKHVSAP